MFDVKLSFEDIDISSVEREDLDNIYNWLERQHVHLKKNELYERFLEYYLSECEFFVKINKDGEFIGIVKGTIEFKNPNEVWIGCFLLDNSLTKNKLGSNILNNIVKYFSKDCGISNFYIDLKEENFSSIKFWKKNNFTIYKSFGGSTGSHVIMSNFTVKT